MAPNEFGEIEEGPHKQINLLGSLGRRNIGNILARADRLSCKLLAMRSSTSSVAEANPSQL
jgi:hypothetical protein